MQQYIINTAVKEKQSSGIMFKEIFLQKNVYQWILELASRIAID